MQCEKLGFIVGATVVDHKLAHSTGWRERFFDETNWQALCQRCHNRKSSKELWQHKKGELIQPACQVPSTSQPKVT
jgi:5-methylcytosine-specific restriction endonuclease McrA